MGYKLSFLFRSTNVGATKTRGLESLSQLEATCVALVIKVQLVHIEEQ
jgi:hypothetical protein